VQGSRTTPDGLTGPYRPSNDELGAMTPTGGGDVMVGLTFKLDKEAAEESPGGQSFLGWSTIQVVERSLFRVEHRTVATVEFLEGASPAKEEARKMHPGSNPAYSVDIYHYTLHCVCISAYGAQEYQSITEEDLSEEVGEGIYAIDQGHTHT